MGVGVRRSDVEIIRDILRMENGGIAPVRYTANLSYIQLKRYLAFLEETGLIILVRQGPQITGFTITLKGRRTLDLLDTLVVTLGYGSPIAAEKTGAGSG